jgi:hypothetical protein
VQHGLVQTASKKTTGYSEKFHVKIFCLMVASVLGSRSSTVLVVLKQHLNKQNSQKGSRQSEGIKTV